MTVTFPFYIYPIAGEIPDFGIAAGIGASVLNRGRYEFYRQYIPVEHVHGGQSGLENIIHFLPPPRQIEISNQIPLTEAAKKPN